MIGLQSNLNSQIKIEVNADVDVIEGEIQIDQKIIYKNNSTKKLNTILLNDWVSSYSNSDTPLVKRFLNEFKTNLYIAKQKNRGFTKISSISDNSGESLSYERLINSYDIIKLNLNKPLFPNDSLTINLDYMIKIQSDKFTGYGKTKKNNFTLNSWYLTPSVHENEWKPYSNLNFDKPYTPRSNVKLSINIPPEYNIYTELKIKKISLNESSKSYSLYGKNVLFHDIILTTEKFKSFNVNSTKIMTNIESKKIDFSSEDLIFKRVCDFIKENLNENVKSNIVLSKVDFKKNSLYGLTLLPDLISPFPDKFKYELAISKNIIKKHLDQVFNTDPRKDYWLKNGFQMLLLIRYMDTYYPEQKLIGKLANVWGIKNYNFSKLNYNEQYRLTYYQMMRTGRDQALTQKKDKLLSFNEKFNSYYKSAVALLYLKNFLGEKDELNWVKDLNREKKYSTNQFRKYINDNYNKNTDWFFEDFINKSFSSDYKIKSFTKNKDSIRIDIKNLKKGAYPVTINSIKNDTVVSRKWIKGFNNKKSITIAEKNQDYLVLNYKHHSPEFNRKNNWKSVNKLALNRPLQIRFIRDVENPNFNQLNIMPVIEFQNVYDGFKFGVNFNNRGLLAKPIIYAIAPSYGTGSKTLTGNAKIIYNKFHESDKLFNTMLGITFDRSSFDYGAFITKIQPFAQFTFRPRQELRSNTSDKLQFRYINIQKDQSSSLIDENEIPPYKIFNTRFIHQKNNIENYKNWDIDLQLSSDFGKINFSYEIRKRTPKDRHYNLRFFSGIFLYNKLDKNETSFNFALDRPTNYLFDYNYIGQSESSGILSQQLVIAEGGFKSMIDPAFANNWMTTLNTSISIWRYVQAYGDIGVLKNNDEKPFFAYDSGIRIDLILDYFELYFPFYSNLGWEINDNNYSNKIRFVFTTDISKLAGLFTRRWF